MHIIEEDLVEDPNFDLQDYLRYRANVDNDYRN